MIRLVLPTTDDLAEVVEALLAAADTRDTTDNTQAARWRGLADQLGDALDQLLQPVLFREDPTT